MTENKSRQDATESTRGTVYHLCVAVQKCYELREDESVLLEELGDITTEDKEQVEIKQYSDTLTDGHLNFWNTLRNWMDDSFNHASYSSLVLHTTQEFGPRASIAKWNESTTESRIHLLRAINASFENFNSPLPPQQTQSRDEVRSQNEPKNSCFNTRNCR